MGLVYLREFCPIFKYSLLGLFREIGAGHPTVSTIVLIVLKRVVIYCSYLIVNSGVVDCFPYFTEETEKLLGSYIV